MWDWTGLAADEGDDAAAWFTALLGFPARLVRHVGSAGPGAQPSSAAALGTDRFCGEWAPGYEIRFNDGFPLLMASEVRQQGKNAPVPTSLRTLIP